MKKSGKKWIAFDFDVQEDKLLNVKKAPVAAKPPIEDVPVTKARSFNFQLHLKPKTVSDLAVHSKKIAEVEAWLQKFVIEPAKGHTAKFLLVTGPSGSGKTATVRVLCEKFNINVSEWLNPVDHDLEVYKGPNQVTRFFEFLVDSKWSSLFCVGGKKVTLVEEFPNALMRSPEEFHSVLEKCYYQGNFGVIFICTDSGDNRSDLSQTLFSEEVRAKYRMSYVSFNSCATTLMKSALKRASSLAEDNPDLFKVPSQNTISAIISSANGDIRSAINQYCFASVLGTSDLPITVKTATKSGNKRKRSNSYTSMSVMSRDEPLGLFHGLGKVLNPKRSETGKLQCNFDKLIDEFASQPATFTAFLFENFSKYFGDTNDAFEASEILSLSQIFLDKWVDHHDTLTFALWLSVLGLMNCNRHKVSKWIPIKGPRKTSKRLNNDVETRSLSITDLFYYNIITKKENIKLGSNLL